MFNDIFDIANNFAGAFWESNQDNFLRSFKMATNYPPYNLKKIGENKYLIEMAVAGFSLDDLEIEIKGNTLIISGHKATEENTDGKWLHRSLASRDFMRKFALDRNLEIKNAELINGILKIWLEFLAKSEPEVKKIPINSESGNVSVLSGKESKQLLQESKK
jgi:molecular chaperone IbpA